MTTPPGRKAIAKVSHPGSSDVVVAARSPSAACLSVPFRQPDKQRCIADWGSRTTCHGLLQAPGDSHPRVRRRTASSPQESPRTRRAVLAAAGAVDALIEALAHSLPPHQLALLDAERRGELPNRAGVWPDPLAGLDTVDRHVRDPGLCSKVSKAQESRFSEFTQAIQHGNRLPASAQVDNKHSQSLSSCYLLTGRRAHGYGQWHGQADDVG